MIKVTKVNKTGNKIVNYTCKDTVLEAELSKKELVEFIKNGEVSNAYIQMYKGTTIVRVKDAVVNQLKTSVSNTTKPEAKVDESEKLVNVVHISELVKKGSEKEDTQEDEEDTIVESKAEAIEEIQKDIDEIQEDTKEEPEIEEEEEEEEEYEINSIFVNLDELKAWEDTTLKPGGVLEEREEKEKNMFKSLTDLFKAH